MPTDAYNLIPAPVSVPVNLDLNYSARQAAKLGIELALIPWGPSQIGDGQDEARWLDVSGHGRDVDLTSYISYWWGGYGNQLEVSGPLGPGFLFDGWSTYGQSTGPTLSLRDRSFAVFGRVRADYTYSDQVFIGKDDGGGTNQRMFVRMESSNRMTFGFGSNDLNGVLPMNDGQEYDIAALFRYGGSQHERKLFVDGRLDAEDTPATAYQGGETDLQIGHIDFNEYWYGLIRYIVLMRRSVPDAEVERWTEDPFWWLRPPRPYFHFFSPTVFHRLTGGSHQFNAVEQAARGGYRVRYLTYAHDATGQSVLLNEFAGQFAGQAIQRNAIQQVGRGVGYLHNPSQQASRGSASVYNVWAQRVSGAAGILIAFAHVGRGMGRLANDAAAGYELYRGVDGEPDFSSPWETFTALPHQTGALDAPPSGTRTYTFLLRQRNRFGLSSVNVRSWSIEIDANGDLVTTPPSAPRWISVEPAAGGKVRVQATYRYDDDGDDQADAFAVWVGVDADPDPDVDDPAVVQSMVKADGLAKLDWTRPTGEADGARFRVLVRTRNSGGGGTSGGDSRNTALLEATATSDGPDAPTGGAFFGRVAQQRQSP